MTPERIAEIAESAWHGDFHSPVTDRAIERAIRQAVNEALEEAERCCHKHNAWFACDDIRALKIPEE